MDKISKLEKEIKAIFLELSNKNCKCKVKDTFEKGFLSFPIEGKEDLINELCDIHLEFRGILGSSNADFELKMKDLEDIKTQLEKI